VSTQLFRHRVGQVRSELSDAGTVLGVALGQIEAKGGFSAVQSAMRVAAFPGAAFEGVQHGGTDATEARIRET